MDPSTVSIHTKDSPYPPHHLKECHRKLHKTDSHTQRNNEPGLAVTEQYLQEASTKIEKSDE